MTNDEKFDAWLRDLEEDVIQIGHGYEPGEFIVYPDQWKPLYLEGLTPNEAFERALNAFADAREEDRKARMENWERIQAEDRAAIARERERL